MTTHLMPLLLQLGNNTAATVSAFMFREDLLNELLLSLFGRRLLVACPTLIAIVGAPAEA